MIMSPPPPPTLPTSDSEFTRYRLTRSWLPKVWLAPPTPPTLKTTIRKFNKKSASRACVPSKLRLQCYRACNATEHAARNSLALAIICKVMPPSKQQHMADLYIESMEPIPGDRVDHVIAMVQQLQRVSTVNHANAATSAEAAWQQRKCRRMQRYPTQT